MVFHVTPTGRALLGEPLPPSTAEDRGSDQLKRGTALKKPKPSLAEMFAEMSTPRMITLGGILAVVVLILGYTVFVGGGPVSLEQQSRRIADALCNGNPDYIIDSSTADTRMDAQHWYEQVHPALVAMRKDSPSKELVVAVLPTEENPTAGKGEVTAFIQPVKAASHAEQIATEAGTSSSTATQQLTLFFLYMRGTWWLDARATLAATTVKDMNAPAPASAPAPGPAKKR
jgi:hypothetical protein